MDKTCTNCKKTLSITSFSFKNKKKNIRHARCKPCVNFFGSKHYRANLEEYKARSKKHRPLLRKRNKKYFNEYKELKRCKYCSESTAVCLDFHHRDASQKESAISRLIASNHSIETILKEVSKCDVVCSNCHRKIHAGIIKE